MSRIWSNNSNDFESFRALISGFRLGLGLVVQVVILYQNIPSTDSFRNSLHLKAQHVSFKKKYFHFGTREGVPFQQ